MKVTLRELFLFVATAALGCGWWVANRDALDARRDAVKLGKDNHWFREQIDNLNREASERGLEITEVLWPVPYFILHEKDDGTAEVSGGVPLMTR
jgi:hypothetical protein